MAGSGPEAVLLTGPVGAGKTTLATEIGELLKAADVAHAVIELDWLSWCVGPGGDAQIRRQLVIENLAAMVSNFQRAGICRYVLAGSIVSLEHLDAVASTLDGIHLEVVRIVAPAELLASRVEERDAARKTLGSVSQAAEFLATTRNAIPDCLEVDNTSGDVSATAEAVLDKIGWRALRM